MTKYENVHLISETEKEGREKEGEKKNLSKMFGQLKYTAQEISYIEMVEQPTGRAAGVESAGG
jgi:hypothetical protein